MPYSYTGNIVHLDLSSGEYWIEHPPESFYRTYWGGRALALYYMLTQMKPHTDPLSPENLLIFATGTLAGVPAPAVPRYTVCARSPLTGAEGEAEAGGWWGPELKRAGFDALIIKGVSSTPVYLWITEGKVEIKEAAHLWGKDTGETQRIIKEELAEDKVRIAQIGPAGENLTPDLIDRRYYLVFDQIGVDGVTVFAIGGSNIAMFYFPLNTQLAHDP